MSLNIDQIKIVYKLDKIAWLLVALAIVFALLLFSDGIQRLLENWNNREEYSHGFLIPVLSLFFLWQNKNYISVERFKGSYIGFSLLLIGLLGFFMGKLATLYIIVHYALLLVIAGLVLSFTGVKAGRYFVIPVVFLIFMIPLPPFLYNNLSQSLQLISSEVGVAVTRWFGVSVYLEGNVIDLGNFKLQVVEACSGLRYLFPLMSFGFICAYLFNAPFWQRVLVFLTTIPITVLMNSFRIGVIGVLVDRWGEEQAEGFLHDFEGWVIFMACVGILFVEMWLLNRFFSKEKRPLSTVFGLDFPDDLPQGLKVTTRELPKPFLASIAILTVALLGASTIQEKEDVIPERSVFATFPESLDGWQGKPDRLDKMYLEGLLGMTDHMIGDYISPEGDRVNLYVAYYETQKGKGAIHSPRSCIPGGGWVIESIEQADINVPGNLNKVISVNRVRITKDQNKQLVYYWFDQRGRRITNEYLLKWYLFWDSLTKQRSDGALVRLTTMIDSNESWEEAESKLNAFMVVLGDELGQYVPD